MLVLTEKGPALRAAQGRVGDEPQEPDAVSLHLNGKESVVVAPIITARRLRAPIRADHGVARDVHGNGKSLSGLIFSLEIAEGSPRDAERGGAAALAHQERGLPSRSDRKNEPRKGRDIRIEDVDPSAFGNPARRERPLLEIETRGELRVADATPQEEPTLAIFLRGEPTDRIVEIRRPRADVERELRSGAQGERSPQHRAAEVDLRI